MAEITTIDVTPVSGSDVFPVNENEFYKAVETIASQNIRAVKSANRIEDAFYEYPVDGTGKVIEEAIIAPAIKQAFVKTGTPDLKPLDPTLYVKYFNNWEEAQFQTTTRKDDIRAIIAEGKGSGVEEVASEILGTLTEGEGRYDYEKMRNALKDASLAADIKDELFDGKHPLNSKGIIYVMREMYNALKSNTSYGGVPVEYSVPVEDIRIAVSEDVLNLLDVTELANVFNLEKEALFGKLVVIPKDGLWTTGRILAYDRKAFGRATRVFDYTQDVVGKGRYTNHYLTTERCYFRNRLYKAISMDVSDAIDASINQLMGE